MTRMLKIQYRMHPEICKYPNYAFYNNLLENSIKYSQKKGLEIIKPYAVFTLHVKDNCIYKSDTEVDCVSSLIRAIMRHIRKTCSYSIGVITPYNNQKEALYKKIKSLKYVFLFDFSIVGYIIVVDVLCVVVLDPMYKSQ